MSSQPEKNSVLTREERQAKKQARRDKQRIANIGRAQKMHQLRLANRHPQSVVTNLNTAPAEPQFYVGCSGWFYWHLRDTFYNSLPTSDWFAKYASRFKTVEINASFYSWPTAANVQNWIRQAGRKKFIYTVKVCEFITHIKRFNGTKRLIKDFGYIADLLGPRMGCFLFQLPPSFKYTSARLKTITQQLDPQRRNVIEFRHASWWNDDVYKAFREAGIIFCSCSGPRLPDTLVKTSDDIYIRFHGVKRWYRHDYTADELNSWIERIRKSKAERIWIYFNNDNDGYAVKNASAMARLLRKRFKPE